MTLPDKLEIAAISDAFLEKHNRPGPRYTSYPTAPVWKDDFGPDDLDQISRCSHITLVSDWNSKHSF